MSQDHALSKAQLAALKQLKKQLSAAAPTTQIRSETQDAVHEAVSEQQLFSQAMQGVTPIDGGNIAAQAHPPRKHMLDAQTLARRSAAEGQQHSTALGELSDTQALLNPVASQAFLSYRISTLQNRVFDELKSGKLRWFEAVDLHGCNIDQARTAVLQLIQLAQADNQNLIKIVHGKGPTATLKTCVNGWLRQHPAVLAFVSAPENQGGTGAVLVLLKRAEKNPKYTEQRK
jgi:DNA-nicking Smr family endonuclease